MKHDVEPEAQSAGRPGERAVRLPEPVENVGQELGADADARVADDDLGLAIGRADLDRHLAARGRELDRVPEQVPDHLPEAIRIGLDRRGLRPTQLELDPVNRRGRTDGIDRLLHDGHHVDRANRDAQLAGDDP